MSGATDTTFLVFGERVVELLEALNALDDKRANQIAELQRGMAALAEAMATRADLDDLRLEVLDRTAAAEGDER